MKNTDPELFTTSIHFQELFGSKDLLTKTTLIFKNRKTREEGGIRFYLKEISIHCHEILLFIQNIARFHIKNLRGSKELVSHPESWLCSEELNSVDPQLLLERISGRLWGQKEMRVNISSESDCTGGNGKNKEVTILWAVLSNNNLSEFFGGGRMLLILEPLSKKKVHRHWQKQPWE